MTYTRYYNGLDMNVQISTLLYQAEDQYCKLFKKKTNICETPCKMHMYDMVKIDNFFSRT